MTIALRPKSPCRGCKYNHYYSYRKNVGTLRREEFLGGVLKALGDLEGSVIYIYTHMVYSYIKGVIYFYVLHRIFEELRTTRWLAIIGRHLDYPVYRFTGNGEIVRQTKIKMLCHERYVFSVLRQKRRSMFLFHFDFIQNAFKFRAKKYEINVTSVPMTFNSRVVLYERF